MEKQVILKLNGNLNSEIRVILEIWSDHQRELEKVGSLPPNPSLAEELQDHWENKYRRIGAPYRLTPKAINYDGSIKRRIQDCKQSADQLSDRFVQWLDTPGFRRIEKQLRTRLNLDDNIRLLIQTSDSLLQKLPWHSWDWIESYRSAEVALSPPEYGLPTHSSKIQQKNRIKILAILGHREGINVEEDRQHLQSFPDAEVTFLVQPKRQDIHDQLWEQHWDIICFAGHSKTEKDEGRIYISDTDSLSLKELRYGLKQAVKKGLKLAIFNSCDGLGLAKKLDDLQIPQMIVMRELVPDKVAQNFLKYFLTAFAGGKSFYLAVREARERLQRWEKQFPCATWLPMIVQNPTETPPTWQQLLDDSRDQWTPSVSQTTARIPAWQRLLMASVMVTGLVCGMRSLGMLQSWELKAFDGLMRLRPAETLDPRMLIVTVTEQDILDQDPNELRGSLSDRSLLELLEQLKRYQPRVIGLDIYRPFPVKPGYQKLEQALRQDQPLIVVCEMGGGKENPSIPPPVEVPLEQVAFSDVPVDPDGIVRRQFLGMSPNSDCDTDKSFSFQVAKRYLTAEGIEFERISNDQFRMGSVNFNKIESSTGGYHNLDTGGYQVLLNYRSAQAPARTVTLEEILSDRIDPRWIQDQIVLIGTTARSIEDGILTPYSAGYSPTRHIPGVFVQAQMVSQILSAVKDNRPLLWMLPLWGEILCIWVGAMMGEILLNVYPKGRRYPIFYLMTGGFILLICSGISLIILFEGGWIPIVPFGLAFILSGVRKVMFTNFSKNHDSNAFQFQKINQFLNTHIS